MPSKLQFYMQMADTTARQVTGSFGEWTAFLETMGRLYKYPFHEQLMIFAQKPNATACADYDLWNKQMDRYVRRGSKGIALLDTTGDNPRLKYVFDVSDTGGRENSRRLNLWEYKDEHHNSVTTDLENRFGVSGEKGLADQLEQIASKLVTEYWNDNRRDILGILADSFLEEYDDYNVEVAFRNAATVSTTYALMSRCGLNPGDYFEHEDFLSVFDFNTRDTIAVLGSAISNSSEQILRQIAVTVKNYEREASLQRQAERTQDYGEQTELHAERGLFNSESDLERDRNEASGQVRSHEEEVSAGESSGAVEQHDFVGDSVPASEGNRRGGEPEIGTDDARTDEAERRDGGTESQRPDDVDGLDEQSQAPGRGSNSRRTDSQLSEQLTLFDVGLFPTEQEQIAIINEAESVKPTPFAFSFAQNDIDDVLRRASNSEYTRMNVAAAFQKQKPMDEIVSLLKKEYHGGAGIKSDNGEFSVWYAEDGIRLAKGRTARYSRTAQIILWEAAAERIGQLMDEGKFASNVELAETELHERTELSHIRNKGLAHFDCWASTFGETTTAIELAPEGTGYRARTRFAKFFNLPELMNLFKEAADIKTADQLNLPTPKAIYHNEVAQPTEIQQAMVQELSERAAAVHAGTVDPSEDNMLRITSDGRKLGLDQRIINPNLPDEPTSKVNMCVDNIHRIWKDGHDNKLTQLVFCDLSTPKSSAAKKVAKAPAGNLDSPEIRALEHLAEKDSTPEEADFTVYDDIREKLVARGIPREQIAFIHEANTEARKKELFSKVRSGQVRVLMGSTFKMGAGMNVQDRLIALHDLDAPWRPGDLEQRSGRIIRQGNMNPEVHIYRYVTEATFDAYLWQTLENKQKFISQIMTSKSPVRACDDIDETALSYAEIKALCAGDERIKEKMDLDVDVARLKLMKSNHQSQQYRLEDNLLRYFPEQIEQSKGFIAGFEADMKTLAEYPHPTEGFAGMTVRGDVLTDKENAGAALVDAFKEVKGLDPVPVGSYRGFQMSLTLEDFGRDYVLTLKGQMTHRVTLGKDPRGNLTRIDNALNGMADRLATVQSKLESLYSQMETAKQEFGKPFPQEDELRVKSARLAELNIALNIDDKTPLEAMAEETPTKNEVAKSARPSVLQKLHSYEKQSKSVTTEPKKSQEEVL